MFLRFGVGIPRRRAHPSPCAPAPDRVARARIAACRGHDDPDFDVRDGPPSPRPRECAQRARQRHRDDHHPGKRRRPAPGRKQVSGVHLCPGRNAASRSRPRCATPIAVLDFVIDLGARAVQFQTFGTYFEPTSFVSYRRHTCPRGAGTTLPTPARRLDHRPRDRQISP